MSIYKDCDIRGIYGKEFDDDTAYQIGRAAGSMPGIKTLAVGGDVRVSTPVLKQRLIEGITESGVDVIDIGMVPTPAFYFALKHMDIDGGITVTASHNPAEYNGFKLMFGDMPVTTGTIKEIERRIQEKDFSEGGGRVSTKDIISPYVNSMINTFTGGRLKVVIDCGNGAMSEIAPFVFRKLGYNVVPLYCAFDGKFPNREPNPAVYENLRSLTDKVRETGADFGAAFDGDGDRVVFVDDRGDVAGSEESFVVFINEYLKSSPSPVVYDIKSSSIVKDAILCHGGQPLMERSGHAFIKKRFRENDAALAGEISGHFFFRELGYDDGLYAALKMAEIIDQSNEMFSDSIGKIPKGIITPDLRFRCSYSQQDEVLKRIEALGRKDQVLKLDGIRVEFSDGWLLVRKSVTEEAVTMRIEADDQSALDRIRRLVSQTIPELTCS